jgi:formylmethanofuran dehydrogenase subunit C
MIAGTVSVGGAIGPLLGRGMKRGTVFAKQLPSLAAGFVDTGTHDLVALRVLARRVPDLAGVLAGHTSARRLVGDTLMGGQGEVLVPS